MLSRFISSSCYCSLDILRRKKKWDCGSSRPRQRPTRRPTSPDDEKRKHNRDHTNAAPTPFPPHTTMPRWHEKESATEITRCTQPFPPHTHHHHRPHSNKRGGSNSVGCRQSHKHRALKAPDTPVIHPMTDHSAIRKPPPRSLRSGAYILKSRIPTCW